MLRSTDAIVAEIDKADQTRARPNRTLSLSCHDGNNINRSPFTKTERTLPDSKADGLFFQEVTD